MMRRAVAAAVCLAVICLGTASTARASTLSLLTYDAECNLSKSPFTLAAAQQRPVIRSRGSAQADHNQDLHARGVDDAARSVAKVIESLTPSQLDEAASASAAAANKGKAVQSAETLSAQSTPATGTGSLVESKKRKAVSDGEQPQQSFVSEWYAKHRDWALAYAKRPEVKARKNHLRKVKRQKMAEILARPDAPQVLLDLQKQRDELKRQRDARRYYEKTRPIREAEEQREREGRRARLRALPETQKLPLLLQTKEAQRVALAQLYGGKPLPWEQWQHAASASAMAPRKLVAGQGESSRKSTGSSKRRDSSDKVQKTVSSNAPSALRSHGEAASTRRYVLNSGDSDASGESLAKPQTFKGPVISRSHSSRSSAARSTQHIPKDSARSNESAHNSVDRSPEKNMATKSLSDPQSSSGSSSSASTSGDSSWATFAQSLEQDLANP